MIKYILLVIIGFPAFAYGQIDVFQLVLEIEQPIEIEYNIDQIEEKVYKLKMNEMMSIDTMFQIDSVTLKPYYLAEKNIVNWKDLYQVETKSYNNEDELLYLSIRTYNKDGRILKDMMDYKESYMKPLSYNKVFEYNEQNKLIHVINKACDTCIVIEKMAVEYNKEGEIEGISMYKTKIGQINYKKKVVKDTIRFIATNEFEEEYIKKVQGYGSSIDDIEIQYIDVFKHDKGVTSYHGVKIDHDTNQKEMVWEKWRNSEGFIVEDKYYKKGILEAHRSFSLDNKGNVTSIRDEEKGEDYLSEFLSEGKYTKLNRGRRTILFDYDDHENWISKEVRHSNIPLMEEKVLRKIVYN